MRLGTKVLLLTLTLTLGLSGSVVWVVTHNVTGHERQRAEQTLDLLLRNYFSRIETFHKGVSHIVTVVLEAPEYRSHFEGLDAPEDGDRRLLFEQFRLEIFGRTVQAELESDVPPAFYVLINEDDQIVLTSTPRTSLATSTAPSAQQSVPEDPLPPALSSDKIAWRAEDVRHGGQPVRQYVWAAGQLYLALGVPLRVDLSQPPTHACFVGYRLDNLWMRRMLDVGSWAGGLAVDALYLVDDAVVAVGTSRSANPQTDSARFFALTDVLKRIAPSEKTAAFAFDLQGERFTAQAHSFSPAVGRRGMLALVSSLDQAQARVQELQQIIGLATAVALIVALLACRKLANMIARPVQQLVTATQRVSQGEFAVPVDVGRSDELGVLARSFQQMAAGLEQRDLIKDTFGKFVDPKIVEGFLSDPSRLRLGGERRVQSVLFSDLAGFTTLSERMPPEDLVRMLNAYLGGAADVVAELHGIVDKFIGDAVVAFWGPPLAERHAELACRAALRMVAQVRALRFVHDDEGQAPQAETAPAAAALSTLSVRVGIATGEVLVGNIGSRSKYNYTVIGDVANLASRLEGLNKLYRTQILVSSDTARQAGPQFLTRRIDTVRVVGRTEPVELTEIMAERDAASDAVRQQCEAYAIALRLYEARNWSAARTAFDEISHRFNDGPSAVMAARCIRFQAQSPATDWDGVWNADAK